MNTKPNRDTKDRNRPRLTLSRISEMLGMSRRQASIKTRRSILSKLSARMGKEDCIFS